MTFSEYVQTRSDELTRAFGQHALVVAVSMAIATVLGVGIGMLTWRRPRLSGFAIATASGFLTIPSFALLGLLIPVLGLGWTPTVFALTLYSLLPIIRNTVVGLRGVDAAIIEAGRGMGMSAVPRAVAPAAPARLAADPHRDPGLHPDDHRHRRDRRVRRRPGPRPADLRRAVPPRLGELAQRGPRRHARRRDPRPLVRPALPHRPPAAPVRGVFVFENSDGGVAIELRELTKQLSRPRPPGGRRDLPRRARRRAGRLRRPVRVRQDDHDEDDQPADRADLRADPHRRRGRPPAATRTSCAATSATSSSRSGCSLT